MALTVICLRNDDPTFFSRVSDTYDDRIKTRSGLSLLCRALTLGIIAGLLSSCATDQGLPAKKSTGPIASSPYRDLTPGSRPIVITVTNAEDFVTRSSVTWGFNDKDGGFVLGGRAGFGPNGGTLIGEIPRNYNPPSVEVKYIVDYSNEGMADLQGTYECPVKKSGVNFLLATTSNIVRPKIIVKTPEQIDKDDWILFDWAYSSSDSSQPLIEQSGSIYISNDDLKAEKQVFVKELAIPMRRKEDGKVTWKLTGSLNGHLITGPDSQGILSPTSSLIFVDLSGFPMNKVFTVRSSSPPQAESVIGSTKSVQPCD